MFSQAFNIGSRRVFQETDLNSIAGSPRSVSRSWWSLKGSNSYKNETSHVTELQQKFSLAKYLVVVTAGTGTPFLAILSQVYGGPLRSIHKVSIGGYPSLLLEFLHEHHAETCRSFIDNRKCIVNGVRTVQSEVSQYHLGLVKPRASDFHNTFTRRTLEISRAASTESLRPLIVSRNINPVHLKKAFGCFGEILEIRPLFLRGKVGFAIEFSDIDGAVQAKEKFDHEVAIRAEEKGEQIEAVDQALEAFPGKCYFRGLHEWTLVYTRANSERNSCY